MMQQQLDTLVENLRRFEGAIPWMYRDTAPAGNVTVGIGVLLPDEGAAVALPFRNTKAGRGATETEIAQDFARVRAIRGGLNAGEYRGFAPLELPDGEVTALAVRRLEDVFLPGLRGLYAGFDRWPWPAQQVLVDMAWNLGLAGLEKFYQLRQACHTGDWARAADESHVATSRPARNEWRAETFRRC